MGKKAPKDPTVQAEKKSMNSETLSSCEEDDISASSPKKGESEMDSSDAFSFHANTEEKSSTKKSMKCLKNVEDKDKCSTSKDLSVSRHVEKLLDDCGDGVFVYL